eukprot:CAMPEP_0197915868 /NCGR_PEP_ID=MMETSP1439-20131203/80977_1 /TAXON_ID=66791 /ORGANISM="Gonyaulax spinifera, Strain CCMP409" /LENGTH=95 /DNA_ID=CAMNT_0043537849 /DNA_START=39 /DNA_END=326 /DNA_ORIENTATION=-
MYLNEHPTWVMTDDPDLGQRSLRWDGQSLSPGMRLKGLYCFSVAKTALLLAAFFTGHVIACFLGILAVSLLEAAWGMLIKERLYAKVQPDNDDLQ